MTTIATLKARARRFGVKVEEDRECKRIGLIAPEGERFEEGLHELVHWYEESVPEWRRAAIQDALDDLNDYGPAIEDCDTPECDWCNPIEPDPSRTSNVGDVA